MYKKVLLLSITLITIFGTALSQERLLEKADEKYNEYSFRPAIDIYKKVREKGFSSPDLLKRLGNSYYFNANYEEASEIYKELIEKYDSVVTPDYVFRYAQSLKTLGEYENADAMMVKFSQMAKESGIDSSFDEDYMSKIDRDTGNLARYRHTWNARDFLDIYEVNEANEEGEVVKKVPGDINTRLHESTSIITKDGNTMYFTRNNFLDGKKYKDEKGTIRLKIYKASLVEGEWTEIEELPFNSDSYSVAHPVLSPDEKVLYFVSDMPGSLGESDIFKVQIIGDGTYGPPINLGKTINTEARETFPFITQSDVLYFSSDGHPGLGGLDVFATKIAFDEYDQTIVNVGKPINGKYDDFSFILDEETNTGYFASNRIDGMGDDDIYSFSESEPISLDCLQDVTGTVRDRISNEILAGATVKIIDEENNEVSSTITNSKGEYTLSLDCNQGNFVRALMEGYVPSEEYLVKSYGKPRIVDFYLERDLVTGGFGDDLAKLLQLSTIYFDLNKFNIRPDAEIEIQKVIAAMEKYPSLKIKVNAHTDSRGNDAYNLWLSQKRAQSTVAYMISKGISADRLDGEGFGEERLMNECENGVRCSNEKHQLNRRSEFIIFD